MSLFQPPNLCNNNCVIFDLFQSLSLFQLGFVSTPEYDTHALHYPSVTTVLGGGGGGHMVPSWWWWWGVLVLVLGSWAFSLFLDLARGPSRCCS